MAEFSVVGQRIPRVDAFSKVTGSAVYSGDVKLPNMLHGKIYRSPYPHARIKRLDIMEAQSLDGVILVLTADDIPSYKKKSLLSLNELPRLPKEKVVYAGQPVAVVIATSVRIAEEAIKLIKVEYEELPPLLDVTESINPEAPLIHPELYTNLIINPQPGENDKPSNISHHLNINKGDIEAGFKEAEVVLENTFRTQKVSHGFIEPLAAVADVDMSGRITIWTQSQGIFTARQRIAQFLDVPINQLNLVSVEIGGAFGGKNYQPLAPLCALAALKTGRPVRMEMTREEVLADSRPAPESLVTIKVGATKEGKITAASILLIYDSGAFPEMSHANFVSHNVLYQYNIANVKVEAMDVLTNKVPVTFYRAPGVPQAAFAVESQLDLLARALDMDPLELRIKNVAVEGDVSPSGEVLPPVGFKETLEKMTEYLAQKEKITGKNRGRGIACGTWHGASGSFGAIVHINSDGTVNLVLGVTDISGSRTSIAQVVAEEFDLPIESVHVIVGDTDTAPWASMSVGSMTVYSLSTAAYRACQDAKAQLGNLAAKRLEVDSSRIEYSGGCFRVKGNPEQSISLADLARSLFTFRGEGPVIGRGSIGGHPPAPTLSAHTADVEVDEDTGKVKVLSYAVAMDVGLAVNPLSIEGQVQGAVAQGIGWALMENYIYDEGVLQNTTLLDYRMPTAMDVPMVETLIVEVPSAEGTYGIKHVGEPPMIPTLGTIANAIHSATGARLRDTPMTPEAVLNGLRERPTSVD